MKLCCGARQQMSCMAATNSLELGRHRERLGGIHHEHDQGGQIGRAGVEDLHRHAGAMSIMVWPAST